MQAGETDLVVQACMRRCQLHSQADQNHAHQVGSFGQTRLLLEDNFEG